MKLSPYLIFPVILLALLFFPVPALATVDPQFPTCSNPGGSLQVSYPDGSHAIVGRNQNVIGSDQVYNLGDNLYLQCFCSASGEGIQTNWWDAAHLSQEELDRYQLLGWYFIGNGADWGLAPDPYLAKNIDYSCQSSNNNSENNSCSSSSSSESSSGTVESTSASSGIGSVMGLAFTGSYLPLAILLSASLSLLAGGFYLRSRVS